MTPKLYTLPVPSRLSATSCALRSSVASAHTKRKSPETKMFLRMSYTPYDAIAPTTLVANACAAKYMALWFFFSSFSSTEEIYAGTMYGIMKNAPIAQLPITPPMHPMRYCASLLSPQMNVDPKKKPRIATAKEMRQVW